MLYATIYRATVSGSRRIAGRWNRVISSACQIAPRTIAVAMSGGIDSAVAALMLKDQGHNVVGVFMKNWDPADECGSETCDLDADHKDMQEVCKLLNIPAYEVNFVREYWNEVFSPFLEAYQAGIETPNPDAFCNRHVKFKHLLNFVTDKLGIDTIATGHYSRIAADKYPIDGGSQTSQNAAATTPARVKLLRGVDPLKDQSYFLALTKGSALERVLLPIGHLSKAEVKAIAARRLPDHARVLSKPESMGICFIGKRDMRDFLDDYITLTPGRFIDLDSGKVVGQHSGFEYYTIGQKARISGTPHKYYVVGRKKNTLRTVPLDSALMTDAIASEADAAVKERGLGEERISGDVYVALGSEHPSLYTPYIVQPLSSMNWIAGSAPPALQRQLRRLVGDASPVDGADELYRCEGKSRYNQQPAPCSVELFVHDHQQELSRGAESSAGRPDPIAENVMMRIAFDSPERAVTPGQIIALYDGEVCLGGGVIVEQPLFKDGKIPTYL